MTVHSLGLIPLTQIHDRSLSWFDTLNTQIYDRSLSWFNTPNTQIHDRSLSWFGILVTLYIINTKVSPPQA